jgi:hypothetical protein
VTGSVINGLKQCSACHAWKPQSAYAPGRGTCRHCRSKGMRLSKLARKRADRQTAQREVAERAPLRTWSE